MAILFAIDLFEASVADVLFARCAISKTFIASPKYRPEDTIAGYILPGAALSAQSESPALRTIFFR
jgi:hypothetical protein